MNLYIYKYNNYYNRIVKKENTLAEYGEPIHSLFGCKDFSPNDGVNTTHVFGSAANNYDGSGDYLIVTNETGDILSRWFIIEINFTRNGQWNLTLRRDLIVDYYDPIVSAPCFIEKATLNADDPLIFNNEGMTVNQIKTRETLLKDKSGCGWIVGYYAKNIQSLQGTIATGNSSDEGYIQLSTPIENWEYYDYYLNDKEFIGNIIEGNYTIKSNVSFGILNNVEYKTKTNIFTYDTWAESTHSTSSALQFNTNVTEDGAFAIGRQYYYDDIKETYEAQYANKETLISLIKPYYNYNSKEDTDELLLFNGKVVRDSNGKYYNIKITQIANPNSTKENVRFESGSMFNALRDVAAAAKGLDPRYNIEKNWFSGTPNTYSFEGDFLTNKYSIIITESTTLTGVTYEMAENRNRTLNLPYDVFAIPYGNIKVMYPESTNTLPMVDGTSEQLAIETAMAIQVQHPEEVYDIQLLPYCPVQDFIESEGVLRPQNIKQYSLIKDEQTKNIGIIFHVTDANFTFNIPIEVPIGQSAIEKKINNECDKWRLASPNYSAYFDFSAEKNNGIQYFNVDCSLKPFTPYLHINPNFNGLYGFDDNSPRGLVLGGDFSLSQIINQWEQYQIQNKNFQLTFDRQIQNMEVQNNIARIQEKWGMGAGVGQGAAAGALAGSMIPGIGTAVGAIGGGVVGGAVSLAGGIADININEQLRTEALDYTRDMFNYQLGNVQALPNTISKVSAFNNNNKIFPVLEYYTCTSRERQALLNKIAWNSMSVGVIGTIFDYIGNSWLYNNIESKGYIKGQIIRIEDLEDEFHLLKEISNEIYKGVYF